MLTVTAPAGSGAAAHGAAGSHHSSTCYVGLAGCGWAPASPAAHNHAEGEPSMHLDSSPGYGTVESLDWSPDAMGEVCQGVGCRLMRA